MVAYHERLMETIRDNQILIVKSETCSGKTTQLSQYLGEDEFSRVVCTQPRFVEAISVAMHVASDWAVLLAIECDLRIAAPKTLRSNLSQMAFCFDEQSIRTFSAHENCQGPDQGH